MSQIVLNGCVPLPNKIRKGSLPRIFNSTSINGLMVGTISIITNNKITWGEYHIRYNMEDTSSTVSTFSIPILPKGIGKYEPTYTKNDTLVFEYVLEHPPGLYKFSQILYSIPDLQGYRAKEDFSKVQNTDAFKIEKGRISYAGNLVIKKHENHKAFIEDRSRRDIPQLSNKYTNIDWSLLKDSNF